MNRLLLLFLLFPGISPCFGQPDPDPARIKMVARSENELYRKVDSVLLNKTSIGSSTLMKDDVEFFFKYAVLGSNHRSILDLFRCDIGKIGESIRIEKEKKKDKDGPTNQLEPLQRVYHVVPNYCTTTTLLEKGLHSASDIANTPDEEFVEQNSKDRSNKEVGILIVFKYWLNWRILTLKE